MSQEQMGSGMATIVERNIEALLKRRKLEDKHKSFQQMLSDKVTSFTGSMFFVYLHIFLFGGWVLWNAGVLGLKPFDPSFVMLAMIASVEAIFLSTFVLISQNRMNALAEKRAELDLQISLLTEHEVTRMIALVRAIAQKMDIKDADHPEIDELSKDVHPEKVMDTMEKFSRKSANNNSSAP
jgi:uncharacterized membrane protein